MEARSTLRKSVISAAVSILSLVIDPLIPNGSTAEYLYFPGFLVDIFLFPAHVHGGTRYQVSFRVANFIIIGVAIFAILSVVEYARRQRGTSRQLRS